MECVFHVGFAIARALVEPRRVAFIVCEQRSPACGSVEVALAQRIWELEVVQHGCMEIIPNQRDVAVGCALKTDQRLTARWIGPSPGVTEPQVGQQMQVSGFRAPVKGLDTNTNVFGA